MIASSSTVLANLAYLIGAVVVAAVIGVAVWLRHRQPKSVDANMASFRRGLSALAPDPDAPPATTIRGAEPIHVRPGPSGLIHVRVEGEADPQMADSQLVEDSRGGESG